MEWWSLAEVRSAEKNLAWSGSRRTTSDKTRFYEAAPRVSQLHVLPPFTFYFSPFTNSHGRFFFLAFDVAVDFGEDENGG